MRILTSDESYNRQRLGQKGPRTPNRSESLSFSSCKGCGSKDIVWVNPNTYNRIAHDGNTPEYVAHNSDGKGLICLSCEFTGYIVDGCELSGSISTSTPSRDAFRYDDDEDEDFDDDDYIDEFHEGLCDFVSRVPSTIMSLGFKKSFAEHAYDLGHGGYEDVVDNWPDLAEDLGPRDLEILGAVIVKEASLSMRSDDERYTEVVTIAIALSPVISTLMPNSNHDEAHSVVVDTWVKLKDYWSAVDEESIMVTHQQSNYARGYLAKQLLLGKEPEDRGYYDDTHTQWVGEHFNKIVRYKDKIKIEEDLSVPTMREWISEDDWLGYLAKYQSNELTHTFVTQGGFFNKEDEFEKVNGGNIRRESPHAFITCKSDRYQFTIEQEIFWDVYDRKQAGKGRPDSSAHFELADAIGFKGRLEGGTGVGEENILLFSGETPERVETLHSVAKTAPRDATTQLLPYLKASLQSPELRDGYRLDVLKAGIACSTVQDSLMLYLGLKKASYIATSDMASVARTIAYDTSKSWEHMLGEAIAIATNNDNCTNDHDFMYWLGANSKKLLSSPEALATTKPFKQSVLKALI